MHCINLDRHRSYQNRTKLSFIKNKYSFAENWWLICWIEILLTEVSRRLNDAIQQQRVVEPMLVKSWASVTDRGTILNRAYRPTIQWAPCVFWGHKSNHTNSTYCHHLWCNSGSSFVLSLISLLSYLHNLIIYCQYYYFLLVCTSQLKYSL